jgi:hypothetical protein
MAQQASPKVAGQIELERAQAMAFSTVVSRRLLANSASAALHRAAGRGDQRHSSAPFFQM